MRTFGRGIVAMGAALVLLFGLAACGGGGGTPTPTEPTATYGGAATAGDIFVIKMDYPAVGKATITRSETDGTLVGSKEMSYTANGTRYTFTDEDSNSFEALMVADTMLTMFLPATDEKDIIVAVIVDPDMTSTAEAAAILKNHDYILTQFRHDEKGVKWVWSNVDADGVVTGHKANEGNTLPYDLDDVDTTNNFDPGMDVDNLVYNAETSGFTLTVGDEIWTYYFTESGLGVIDKGPDKGIRFNMIKPATYDPTGMVAVGDIYDTLFYGRRSETEEGTTQGTITVTAVTANSFTVDVDNGRDPVMTGIVITADLSDLWRGFYRLPATIDAVPQNAVVQLVGSDAMIFAGKAPAANPWQYEYGIGVKRK
ncbi:MAG: hypothetical protein JXA24_06555 [Proteobacteria bacterium]|nr:hypothetical protein [Pseudomonadota bacterium]